MHRPPRLRKVLLTGATGFVGRHLYPALCAAGYEVRCTSRRPHVAAQQRPDREWVLLDVEEPHTTLDALSGCDSAVFLVHGLQGGPDFPKRERQIAANFASAAERSGIRRIVYLGAVAPTGRSSRHLESRLTTGRTLRAGAVPTVELRAAMIIGKGSASWQMVRDLAVRLPAMMLPTWLDHRSCPVAIDDAVGAVLIALDAQTPAGCYDVPGTECISHREVLNHVANLMGGTVSNIKLPMLSPRLSSYWIALVTRVDLALASRLIEGLQSDLIPQEPVIWSRLPGYQLRGLERAVLDALEDETASELPTECTVHRMKELGRQVTERLGQGE